MKCPKCGRYMARVNEGERMDGWRCYNDDYYMDVIE